MAGTARALSGLSALSTFSFRMSTLSVRDVTVPRLGLGTYKLQGADAVTAVSTALEVGYRHIDTAAMYENEEAVGEGIRRSGVPRADVFLTTKVWRDKLTHDALVASTEASLRRLGTDYVDLLLMHWPNESVPLEETLGALAAVRDAGNARLIGVSNVPAGMLRRALEIEPTLVCDQVEYHVFLGQEPLLDVVREHRVFLTAYRPIVQGEVGESAAIREIAEAHGATPVQVALAWLFAQDRVAAVPKATSRAHIEANLAALDLALTPDEIAMIDALDKDRRMVDPGFAPDWDA